MLHLIEINELAELDRYRLQWRSLLDQTRGATFGHSLAWLQSSCAAVDDNRRLRVSLVYGGGELIGILPLIDTSLATQIGSVRVLTDSVEPGMGYGPIGPNPTATLAAVMRYLGARRDWDMIDFRGIDPEIDAGRTQSAMRCAGMQGWQTDWCTRPRIDFAGTWNAYLASRGTQLADSIQQADRLGELGILSYERHRPRGAMYADDDPRWDALDECLDSASPTLRPLARSDDWSPIGTTAACRQLHAAITSGGALDLNILRCQGRVIACAYNHVWGGVVQGVWLWGDKQKSQPNPTDWLLARMVRDSFRRGDRAFHFDLDSPDAAAVWSTYTGSLQRCSHYRLASASSQLLRLQRWLSRPSSCSVSWPARWVDRWPLRSTNGLSTT